MKGPLIILSFALVVSAQAGVKLNIYFRGTKVGSGSDQFVIQRDGKRISTVTNHLTINKKEIYQTRTAVYDSLGRQVSIVDGIVRAGAATQTSVYFDSKGAHATVTKGGTKRNLNAAPLPNLTTKDASGLWFLRDKPKAGETVVYQQFDSHGLKWVRNTTTFQGRQAIVVGGKRVQANAVVVTFDGNASTEYVDDQGQLLLLETSGLRFERAW